MTIATEFQHVHVLSTWTWCPRVQYFKSRYIDLHKRFSRTAGAFPASWHDKNILNQLSKLCTVLGKHPRIIVTGDDVELKEFDIAPNDIDCKIGDKLEVGVFCKRDLQLENWKQCLKNLMIQTEDGESRVSVDIIVVGTCSSTSNEEKADNIESLKTWLREKEIGIPVLMFPKQKELSNEIEKILEVHIMGGFEHMYSYIHQYFIRKSITYYLESTDVLNLDMIVAVVKDTVQDGDLSSRSRKRADTATDSFETEIIRTICRRLLCAIVSPLAAKYNIREFLCYKLLTEFQFEKTISKAVSRNTRYKLFNVCYTQTENNRYRVSSILPGNVLREVQESALSLRADIHNVDVIKTQRVTTVMRKMTFEIKGYLRQSLVSSSILDIEIQRPKISAKLLHGILRMKSVCTMGIVYGELEIHLSSKSEKSESDVKNEIAEQMQKHDYHFPYIIRVVDQAPEHFVRQGDKTLCPCPNNRSQRAIGSVGCFVKDQQGMPHLLTCAHVVASPANDLQTVLIEENVDGKQKLLRFGLSTPQKRIHSGDEVNFPLIDIAAVCVADNVKIRGLIDYTMTDDSGKPKSVSVLCDISEDLVGTTVYKYGAITHLTHGLISSIIFRTNQYEMIVEDPPDISDNDKILDAVNFKREEHAKVPRVRGFAEPGDSGAIICFNDYYVDPTGTIIAATMLSGGDSSPKYFSFSLARGLELLSRRGYHFYM